MAPKANAETEPQGHVTFRVWREAEQRWYTEPQLRRKAFFDKIMRKLGLSPSPPQE